MQAPWPPSGISVEGMKYGEYRLLVEAEFQPEKSSPKEIAALGGQRDSGLSLPLRFTASVVRPAVFLWPKKRQQAGFGIEKYVKRPSRYGNSTTLSP
jgi:hypothetical protein